MPPIVAATPNPRHTPYPPTVISVTQITADRAASIVRTLYPNAHVTVDHSSNAVIVQAPADQENAMRTVITGIDVKSPFADSTQVLQVRASAQSAVLSQLRSVFPQSRFTSGPNHTIIVSATQQDLTQINSLVGALDTPPSAAPAATSGPTVAVSVTQRQPKAVARAVQASTHGVRVMVSGNQLLLTGPDDAVSHARDLIAQLDQPQANEKYTRVYQLHYVDAQSVADLLQRSFHGVQIQVDKDLNALSVLADAAIHRRIADAISQLDGNGAQGTNAAGLPVAQPGQASTAYAGPSGESEVYNMRAAVPGLNGSSSTSATDLATSVTQALSGTAPDLKITVPANTTQLILTGSPYSIKLARDLIDQLDVAQPLVVLDTEVLEVDETIAKNLGLQMAQPVLSTTLTESSPPIDATTGATPPPTLRFQSIGRTPLTLGLQLNLLIQNGSARILSDPRITTVSGRTASIRAGDTYSILTTAGGGTGTVATTQIQSFQTGVTLDITPVVNAGNFITVTLHPVVNNLSGILNGVPQISTRDTTTTVGLQSDQTLVIGGLIEDTTNKTENKVPLLGDLPLIGAAFRNESVNRQRNELIITVTPHIVIPGSNNFASTGPPLPNIPTPQPLPTLPPGTTLPTPRPDFHTPAPTEAPLATAPPAASRAQTAVHPTNVPLPQPSALPSPAPSAQLMPSPFSKVNVFTYGQPPQSNYAKTTDPVQIYYAEVSPTVIKDGAQITVTAITSSNASGLTFGYGTFTTPITQTGPGEYQSTFQFHATGIPMGNGPTNLILQAKRVDGSFTSVPVPITVTF
jgi:type II secretory pathway component GspD/PulD (secretin)